MPRPSLSNRGNFKAYLRHFKAKFNGNLQKLPEYWIDAILSSKAAGISTTTDVNVVIFDNKDTVDITTATNNNELIYIPALPGDEISLKIGSSVATLTFDAEGDPVTFKGTTYNLNDTIPTNIGGKNLVVKGLGGALLQPSSAPAYSVGISTGIVNEGSSVDITVNTTDVGAGTTLYYSTNTTTASAADFTDNSLTGSFVVVSTGSTTGVATITRSITSDAISESTETFKIEIREGSTSGTKVAETQNISINSIDSYYTITPSAASVNEGSSVSFTVNTAGVSTSQPLYYSTGGSASAADFTDNSLTGSFSLVSTGSTTGVGTIVRAIATDFNSESGENFNIAVRTGSVSGSIVATSSNVTIGDVTPTVNVAESATSVNEGGSVTFTISGSNIPDGTYYYTIYEEDGTVASTDFNPANLNGSFSVSNNSGSITITIAEDITSEGPDKFKIQIRTGSISGTVIAESSAITINDTSRTPGSTANGLTFGPVQVNRDDSNPGYESDWFAICDIDTLPEGSSIALFIDTSGSMTMATVQASYDKFVAKLNAKNITITTVTNSNEDWITPFLVDLP